MSLYYQDDSVTLHQGDCIDVMRALPDNSVDSIVTDPPYGLGFMGKEWDALPPGLEWAEECLRVLRPGGHLLAFGGTRTWHRLAVAVEDAGFEIRDSLAWLYGSGFPKSQNVGKKVEQWEGWGTALKPAFEPVVMGRKPFKGTVAANVLAHGTGALNIGASRIAHVTVNGGNLADNPHLRGTKTRGKPVATGFGVGGEEVALTTQAGRHPANVILDESEADALNAQAGAVSRFFYVAKAPKKERPVVDGIAHPTVKPLALMRYLVNLVTPPGGTVLEPFAGSGTTVEACLLEGLKCIAIERDDSYMPLIQARIERQGNAVGDSVSLDIFGGAA